MSPSAKPSSWMSFGLTRITPAPAVDAAVAVVLAVDRGVVLVVRAQRLQQQPAARDPRVLERVHRELRLAVAVAKRRPSRGPFGRNSVRPLSIAPRSPRSPGRPPRCAADQRVVCSSAAQSACGNECGCRAPSCSGRVRMHVLHGRSVGLDPSCSGWPKSTSTAVSTSICGSTGRRHPSRTAARTAARRSRPRSAGPRDGGTSRPREACTAPIESSTVTRCSPPPRRSRSVRPSVGRMIARRPVTTCERFSFVDTCTVRSTLRSAASVTLGVGRGRDEVAAHPHEDAGRAVAHRPDRLDGVVAVLARGGELELAVEGVEEGLRRLLVDAHRAVALHVASGRAPGTRRRPAGRCCPAAAARSRRRAASPPSACAG